MTSHESSSNKTSYRFSAGCLRKSPAWSSILLQRFKLASIIYKIVNHSSDHTSSESVAIYFHESSSIVTWFTSQSKDNAS